jgi:hypothetical protein
MKVYAIVRTTAFLPKAKIVHKVYEKKKDALQALTKLISQDPEGSWSMEKVRFRESD